MHDVFTVGVPLLVILGGILLNRSDYHKLEAQMSRRFDRLEAQLNARFDRVDDDLRRFYTITGEHEGRISSLERHNR